MAGRDRQSSLGHRQGEGPAAHESAQGWARCDVEGWGGLRSRHGGIGWDAREWGRVLEDGMLRDRAGCWGNGAGCPAMGQDIWRWGRMLGDRGSSNGPA